MDLEWLGSPHVSGKTGTRWLFPQPVLDGGWREVILVPLQHQFVVTAYCEREFRPRGGDRLL